MKKPDYIIDPNQFKILQDSIGIGEIVELSNEEVSKLANHIPGHPETIYTACSGYCLANSSGFFDAGTEMVAIEWVRHETTPSEASNEPEINTYRYLFGITKDGHCMGYNVTAWEAAEGTGQVADHWCEFDQVTKRHFPEECQ
jgi:hypothetical protein